MAPQHRRLMQLTRDYALDDRALAALEALLRALADPAAPTSVHQPARAVDVHIADSLAALALPELRSAERVADLGAGAGLPGLALAAALPSASVALVESNAQKCDFLRATSRAMGLSNVKVVQARVEEWHVGHEALDVACARAVAALPVLVEYAAPLLRLSGALVAWKGAASAEETADGAAAAAALGCEPVGVISVTPFSGSERRTLHVYRKADETPPGYPRRVGVAAKRPLSAKK